MQILGLDGGMTRLGIGVVKVEDDQVRLVTHGLIYHPRDPEQKFNQHLNSGIAQIVTDFPRLLDLTKPDLIISEYIPAGKLGSNDSLIIAAVTTCKVIAFQFGIDWVDIAASTVKKELTGDGRASKILIRNTVFDLYPLVEARHKQLKVEQKQIGEKVVGLPQDVFDGLAIAHVGANLYGKKNMHELQEDEESNAILLDP